MAFQPPSGMRFDTSVPDRCTATDAQLQAMGPGARSPGSRIGGGTAEGIFFAPITHAFILDRYKHDLDVMNNADEQILLVRSEGFTVVRGRMNPDGSSEFNPTTCFPAPPAGPCADDYILQLKSSTSIPAYTRNSGGAAHSYATTPPTCPARGYWETTVRFWWSDGSSDSVVSRQPCVRGVGATTCLVPNLRGKTRAAARRALARRHCRLGAVKRPAGASRRSGALRVRSQSNRAGRAFPAGHRVSVVLGRTGSPNAATPRFAG